MYVYVFMYNTTIESKCIVSVGDHSPSLLNTSPKLT